jgi:hypothetical protein
MEISKNPLVLICILMIIAGCGSDVPPGKVEGAPRSSESIYNQDLKFLQTKSKLFQNQSDSSQILFGDLHVHTTYSFDAYAFGTVATPADAYRYAKGEAIRHPGGFDVKLRQPLDFYAVTDHAMFLGAAKEAADTSTELSKYDFAEVLHNINAPDNMGMTSIPQRDLGRVSVPLAPRPPRQSDGTTTQAAQDRPGLRWPSAFVLGRFLTSASGPSPRAAGYALHRG